MAQGPSAAALGEVVKVHVGWKLGFEARRHVLGAVGGAVIHHDDSPLVGKVRRAEFPNGLHTLLQDVGLVQDRNHHIHGRQAHDGFPCRNLGDQMP